MSSTIFLVIKPYGSILLRLTLTKVPIIKDIYGKLQKKAENQKSNVGPTKKRRSKTLPYNVKFQSYSNRTGLNKLKLPFKCAEPKNLLCKARGLFDWFVRRQPSQRLAKHGTSYNFHVQLHCCNLGVMMRIQSLIPINRFP